MKTKRQMKDTKINMKTSFSIKTETHMQIKTYGTGN